jgi:hypothetical protein
LCSREFSGHLPISSPSSLPFPIPLAPPHSPLVDFGAYIPQGGERQSLGPVGGAERPSSVVTWRPVFVVGGDVARRARRRR